jgi:hypothetical protein
MVYKRNDNFWCIVETRLPLAGEKAIRYRPADVSFSNATENVRLYALLPIQHR